jgi:antitoxin (DNA-binding transcriptional repressor) of toxin-antitoxin stability system
MALEGMPSIGLSQLRDTRQLLAWLHAGKTVKLRDRGKVIARFIPEKQDADQMAGAPRAGDEGPK